MLNSALDPDASPRFPLAHTSTEAAGLRRAWSRDPRTVREGCDRQRLTHNSKMHQHMFAPNLWLVQVLVSAHGGGLLLLAAARRDPPLQFHDAEALTA
jgi:hypothetical protein